MQRGSSVTAPGNVTGRYVGQRNGVVWVAWQPGDFAPMCAALDGGEMAVADLDSPDLHALPATTQEAFDAAIAESLRTGDKVVAAFGRIAPHSRRRAAVRK